MGGQHKGQGQQPKGGELGCLWSVLFKTACLILDIRFVIGFCKYKGTVALSNQHFHQYGVS